MGELLRLLLGGLASLPAMAAVESAPVPQLLRICADESEWPPFTYFQRQQGQKTRTVIGYNVDYLQLMLQDSGHAFVIDMLPWKRCLAEGASGHYDIVLDGVRQPEREMKFRFPPSHYQLTPIYLYRSDLPNPDFNSHAAMANLTVCGQAGYAYNVKGTPLENLTIHAEANSLEAALQMLRNGRCDALVSDLEVMIGYRVLGRVDVFADPRLRYKLAGFPAANGEFYMMVSPATPYHEALLQLVSKAIIKLQQSGHAQQLLQQYVPAASQSESDNETH